MVGNSPSSQRPLRSAGPTEGAGLGAGCRIELILITRGLASRRPPKGSIRTHTDARLPRATSTWRETQASACAGSDDDRARHGLQGFGRLRVTQPRTSKHLRVLREVGLVRVREAGQQRLYGLEARGLQPVHEWVIGFEQYWNENFDRLNEYVKKLQQKEHADGKRS